MQLIYMMIKLCEFEIPKSHARNPLGDKVQVAVGSHAIDLIESIL